MRALHDAQGALDRALASRSAADLGAAVRAGESAVAAAKAGSQERAVALLVLGEARAARYEAGRSLEDIEACVAVYRQLKDLVPADDWSTTAVVLQKLASYSLVLGSLTGQDQLITDAVTMGRDLAARAEAQGDPSSVLAAAEVLELVRIQLPDGPAQGTLFGLYGSALLTWTKMTDDASHLDAAVAALDAALDRCPPGTAHHAPFLVILGELQRIRYQFSGMPAYLDQSILTMIRTLELYPPSHPVFAATTHDLGVCYLERHEQSGEPTDTDQAERYLRIAALRTTDSSVRVETQKALAELVEPRRSPLPSADRLTFLAGPGSTPQGPPSTVGDDLADLAAHSMQLRTALRGYERTGDPAVLEKIRDNGHALIAALPEDHPHRWMIGGTLGAALVRRFQRHGRPDDADEAVDLLRESVHRPDHGLDDSDRIDDLANLAVALVARARHNDDVADLDEAIPHARRALRLTALDRPERSGYLGALGTALVYRSMLTGDRLDADESVAVGQEALGVAGTPAEQVDAHVKLANRLRHRFRLTGQTDDSDAAIRHLRIVYGMTNDPSHQAALQEALDEKTRSSRT